MKQKLLFLSLFGLVNNACITIQDTSQCAVAGILSAGGICAHSNSPETYDLTFKEYLDFLEAQPERKCVPIPGTTICADDQSHGAVEDIPARGAAICMSSQDWNTMKTELEAACRQLGAQCSYAVKSAIARMTP